MNEINLKVSGKGQVKIGNLAQGKEVNINSGAGTMNVTVRERAMVDELLQALRQAPGASEEREKSVAGKVQELGHELAAEPKNPGKIQQILMLIKENHDWAFPVIAAVATKVVPAVAALL